MLQYTKIGTGVFFLHSLALMLLGRDIENDQVASKLEREQFRLHQEQIKHGILISNTVSEVFGALEKDQKFFIAQNGNIKYTTFNYRFVDL